MRKWKAVITLTIVLVLALGVIGIVWANRSAQTGIVATTTARGVVHAIVVGINDYCPLGVGGPDLNFSVNDAQDAKAALIDAYGVRPGRITLLLDGAATKLAILEAISGLKSDSKDDVVIFLSGHGTIALGDLDDDGEQKDNAYLVNTSGTACDDGTLDFILDGVLKTTLEEEVTANRIIVLGDFSFPSGFNNDLSQVPNILYIAGAKGEEFESATIQNGVFTEKFINLGIRDCNADDPQQNPHGDGNNIVTMEEAFDYANHVAIPGVPGAKPNIVDNLADDVHPRPVGNTRTC